MKISSGGGLSSDAKSLNANVLVQKQVEALPRFKVAQGKIVEHWDVIQEIPAKMAHKNGMF